MTCQVVPESCGRRHGLSSVFTGQGSMDYLRCAGSGRFHRVSRVNRLVQSLVVLPTPRRSYCRIGYGRVGDHTPTIRLQSLSCCRKQMDTVSRLSSMKFLPYAVACLIALGCPVSFGKAPPKLVDFDHLLEKPERFDGKVVRVRGFLYVSLPPHDVGIIKLCEFESDGIPLSQSHRCFLVSLRDAQIDTNHLKSGWVEITARLASSPVGVLGAKLSYYLTEIRRLEATPEEQENPGQPVGEK